MGSDKIHRSEHMLSLPLLLGPLKVPVGDTYTSTQRDYEISFQCCGAGGSPSDVQVGVERKDR